MSKVVTLAVAVLLIGFIGVGMYAYLQDANLDKWGTWEPLIRITPILFVAGMGVGGIAIYAFVRKR